MAGFGIDKFSAHQTDYLLDTCTYITPAHCLTCKHSSSVLRTLREGTNKCSARGTWHFCLSYNGERQAADSNATLILFYSQSSA